MSEPMFEVDPAPEHGLESIGPFEVHKLRLDGFRIPKLEGQLNNGMWYFALDERFACEVPEIYGQGVATMIANAIAIGAGYSCFGKNSQPSNPFQCRIHGIVLSEVEIVPEISENAS